jgi:hypothetical protein
LSIRQHRPANALLPRYDPSTLPCRDHTLALSMLGKHDGLSRRALLTFAPEVVKPWVASLRGRHKNARRSQPL